MFRFSLTNFHRKNDPQKYQTKNMLIFFGLYEIYLRRLNMEQQKVNNLQLLFFIHSIIFSTNKTIQ